MRGAVGPKEVLNNANVYGMTEKEELDLKNTINSHYSR